MRLMRFAFIALLLLGLVGTQSAFIVTETQQVIVFRFSEVVRIQAEPGLYFRVPFVEQTTEIEKRIIPFQLPNKGVILADQRNIEVDAFARYQITDPQRYYTRTLSGDKARAESQLSDYLSSALTTVLGRSTLGQIVKDDRGDLMVQVASLMRRRAAELGINIVDVRLQSVDLPLNNRAAVYEQMKAEREQEASEIRAKGEERAKSIRAQALIAEGEIRGDAIQLEQEILGEADALRTAVLSEAYDRNVDFARRWLALEGYQKIYEQGGPPLLLSPDKSFFRFLDSLDGSGQTPFLSDGLAPNALENPSDQSGDEN